MSHRLIAVVACLCTSQLVLAAEKPAAPGESKSKALSGRRKIETLLQAPAGLDFGDQKFVTVKDLLAQLRERHQLSTRFDLPTFAWLFGPEAVASKRHAAASVARVAAIPKVEVVSRVSDLQTRRNSSVVPASTNSGRFAIVPIYSVADQTSPAAPATTYADPLPASAVPVPASRAVPLAPPQPLPATNKLPAQSPVGTPVSTPVSPTTQPPAQAAPAYLPVPQPPMPPAGPAEQPVPAQPSPKSGVENNGDDSAGIIDLLLNLSIGTETIDLKNVSVATVLQLIVDASPTSAMLEDFSGMPIPLTNALMLDYLVEDDGVLITTRVKALLDKETRVYSIRHLKDCPAEELAKIIRQSVRPWSWRSQINDLGDQLKGAPLPADLISSAVKTGIQLVGGEVLPAVSVPSPTDSQPAGKAEEAKQMAMLGNAVVNGLVTFAHASLTALEMMHYAEPPNGTIQTLPGKLIVTQSQAAHREIAELLRQLAEE